MTESSRAIGTARARSRSARPLSGRWSRRRPFRSGD